MKASQFVLDLPYPQSWDEANFIVTDRNRQALGLVNSWPGWPATSAIIFGPPQSGKTYLAKIWQKRSQAEFLDPSHLDAHVWSTPYAPLILENIDSSSFCETALFHHLNLAREHGSFILLTALTPPGEWVLNLPDLRSRVRSYPAAGIEPPDEEHLAVLLLKHFSDRQIEVTPDVITYLLARMERTMATAQTLIAYIDKLALSEHRKITRAFAAKVLKELNAADCGDNNGEGESS